MDPIGENVSSSLFNAFVFILAIYAIKWFIQKRTLMNIFKKNGIPSVVPSNKFMGSINEVIDDVTGFFNKCLAEHGDVFGYFFGGEPTLVVKNPDVLTHVFIKEFSNFRDRPVRGPKTKPFSESVAFVNGPRWKETRNLLSPCFSSKKLKLMHSLMDDSVSTFLEILDKNSKTATSIDIFSMSEALSMDVINKCALAIKNDCQTNREEKFLVSNQVLARIPFNKAVKLILAFPLFGKLIAYLTKNFDNPAKDMEKHLRNVIEFRRKNPSNKYADMLQLMLDAADNENSGQIPPVSSSKKLLTDDEIVANAMVFVVAGFGTTSNALTTTFYLLAKHQDVQDKLRDEINERFPNSSPDSYDVISSLEYLDQIWNENLRMYPPVTTFVSRQCASTTTINGLIIPKGMYIEVPVYHIHNDPKIWPNPEVFDPSRFTAENKHKIKPMSFIPFGTGPRNCIGMRFALMEAKLTICRAIHKYRFVFSEKTEDPLHVNWAKGVENPSNQAVHLSVREI